MARFILGALVTQISGSIGGTTFRKVGSQNIMSNKSAGTSKNVLLKNPTLPFLAWLLRQWKFLPQLAKDSWSAKAEIIPFTDKFGNTVYLSGRQLFTKLNGVAFNAYLYPVDIDTLVTNFETFALKKFEIDLKTETAVLDIASVSGQVYFVIRAQMVGSYGFLPNFTRSRIIFTGATNDDIGLDLWDSLVARFGTLTLNSKVRLYVEPINRSGFVAPVLTIDAYVYAS